MTPKATLRRVLVAVAIVAVLVAGTSAVTALSSKGGQQLSQNAPGIADSSETGDFFAASLAIGDFDADRRDDVLAGAPFENRGKKKNVGLVQVLYGHKTGLSDRDAIIHPGTKGLPGSAKAGDMFATAVAVGDFDGDGFDDAAIGAPGRDTGSARNAGAVTILYGSRRGLSTRGALLVTATTKGVEGAAQPHAALGASLAVGDFNGDGRDDLAAGAPGAGGSAAYDTGAVYVFYGSKRGLTTKASRRLELSDRSVPGAGVSGDAFGAALAAGDFDRSGHDDLAIGAPGTAVGSRLGAGNVYVLPGSNKGLRPSSATRFDQNSSGLQSTAEADDRFGAALGAGDFDGDRRDDLAIGAPGEAAKSKVAAGMVHVLYGTKRGLNGSGAERLSQSTKGIKSKTRAGDEFGSSFAIGDFNDSGHDDLAIGVPGERVKGNNGAGVVHVLHGGPKGLRTTSGHQWYWAGRKQLPGGPHVNAGFGRALAAGDIDRDGRDDLVVGAPGAAVGGDAAAGNLSVIFG